MLTFKLSPEMVAIIGKALGAQPYDIVSPVITELQKQINEQEQKTEPSTFGIPPDKKVRAV